MKKGTKKLEAVLLRLGDLNVKISKLQQERRSLMQLHFGLADGDILSGEGLLRFIISTLKIAEEE